MLFRVASFSLLILLKKFVQMKDKVLDLNVDSILVSYSSTQFKGWQLKFILNDNATSYNILHEYKF